MSQGVVTTIKSQSNTCFSHYSKELLFDSYTLWTEREFLTSVHQSDNCVTIKVFFLQIKLNNRMFFMLPHSP